MNNHSDDYVNEIVNINEKNNNFFQAKKFKNSLDFEKLKSEDYLNYKLKEKIYNFLIPLNLSPKIKEEIFLKIKKFKKNIKESILIPIVSYIVIKHNNLNISQNELCKKLKLRKSWYIKYAKYFKSNDLDINEIQYLTKSKKKKKGSNKFIDNNNYVVINNQPDNQGDHKINDDNKNTFNLVNRNHNDAAESLQDRSMTLEYKEYQPTLNKETSINSEKFELFKFDVLKYPNNSIRNIIGNRKQIAKDSPEHEISTKWENLNQYNNEKKIHQSEEINCINYKHDKNERKDQVQKKNENEFFDFEKNFSNSKSYLETNINAVVDPKINIDSFAPYSYFKEHDICNDYSDDKAESILENKKSTCKQIHESTDPPINNINHLRNDKKVQKNLLPQSLQINPNNPAKSDDMDVKEDKISYMKINDLKRSNEKVDMNKLHYHKFINLIDKNQIEKKRIEASENFEYEKNNFISTFTNSVIRLKEYSQKNNSAIKNYFTSNLGENTKKKKNYSYKASEIDEKIDIIYDKFFFRNDNSRENVQSKCSQSISNEPLFFIKNLKPEKNVTPIDSSKNHDNGIAKSANHQNIYKDKIHLSGLSYPSNDTYKNSYLEDDKNLSGNKIEKQEEFHKNIKNNHCTNCNKMEKTNDNLSCNVFNVNISRNKSFDFLQILEEIMQRGKKFISQNYLFFRNLNISNELKIISLIRFLLEENSIKIKLEIFKSLFDISTSGISKTCKIYKHKFLGAS